MKCKEIQSTKGLFFVFFAYIITTAPSAVYSITLESKTNKSEEKSFSKEKQFDMVDSCECAQTFPPCCTYEYDVVSIAYNL